MSLPTFSHATAGTVLFSRAYVFPSRPRREPRQRIGHTDDGDLMVATLGRPHFTWQLEFRQMPQADRDAVTTFLDHAAINDAEGAFTFTDVEGTAHSVHCLDFDAVPESDDNYTVTFTLWERGT